MNSESKKSTANKSKISIQELKVAQTELVSGDISGNVYIQNSPGAVFLPIDRNDALRALDDKIRNMRARGSK